LPAKMKRYIANNNIKIYTIDAGKIARDLGLRNKTNMIMQAAFFKLANIIPVDEASKYLKDSIEITYRKKGDDVIKMNFDAVDHGISDIKQIDVPDSWKDASDNPVTVHDTNMPPYIRDFLIPVNRLEGDNIPVSGLLPVKTGAFPLGTCTYEKRGIASYVPKWNASGCVQCNACSFVCPHACIRPILTTNEQTKNAPKGYEILPANGAKEYDYRISISPYDCTGCGNCVNVCPSKKNALEMIPMSESEDEARRWEYVAQLPEIKNPFNPLTVKGSQFERPMMEFSGACAGCCETPYMKLLTQLYGDRMMISNSAGCTQVFCGSAPSTPFTVNKHGYGPAWSSSLFEDTAEFGLGMLLAEKQIGNEIEKWAKEAFELHVNEELDLALSDWIQNRASSVDTMDRALRLSAALEKVHKENPLLERLYENKDYFAKRSHWLIGGDGWSYDIGYSGLDHVLASGENINVLVLDTEVYSNTGGQASKATPTAAITKFAASGKKTKKKDLGRIFMTYGYIYVAQICMGADKAQTLKAIAEAEAYPGPSIVIAYCPCINHGIKSGMGESMEEGKRAVECGYWALYRHNPALIDEGKNPFVLDSKEPTKSFREFLLNENRYASLIKAYPEEAESLLRKTERDAMDRLDYYKKMALNSDNLISVDFKSKEESEAG